MPEPRRPRHPEHLEITVHFIGIGHVHSPCGHSGIALLNQSNWSVHIPYTSVWDDVTCEACHLANRPPGPMPIHLVEEFLDA